MLMRYIPSLSSRTLCTKRYYSEGFRFASLQETRTPKGNGVAISRLVEAGQCDEQELIKLYNEAPDVTGAVILIQRQDPENALKTYKTLRETRQPTMVRALSTLLSRLRHNNRSEEACQRFQDLEKYNLELNEVLLSRFLHVAVEAENAKLLTKLLTAWGANDDWVDNAEEIGTLFLSGFSRVHDFAGMVKAYTALIAKVPPTNAILGKMIKACKDNGFSDRIQYLWRDALRYKVDLNSTNYTLFFQASVSSEGFRKSVVDMFSKIEHTSWAGNATFLISELTNVGDLDSLLKVYSQYREAQTPSAAPFNAMVTGCRKLLKPSGVVPFIGDLLNTDVKEIRVSIGNFVQAISDAADGPSAMRLFQAAQDGQLDLDNYDYSNIIRVLARYVSINTAIECMFFAEKKGITPSVHIITTLVNACGNNGELQKGRALHEKIKRIGSSDHILQCALVTMYAKCNSPVEAQTIIDQLLKQEHVENGVYTCVMDAYGRLKQEKQLGDLFTEMKRRGVKEIDYIIVGKMTALSLLGKHDLAIQTFKKYKASGASPNRMVYLCLITAYAESGRPDLAEMEMDRHIQYPQIELLLTIMRGYGPKNIRQAQSIFAKILEANPERKDAFDLMHSFFVAAKMKREQLAIERMMDKITRAGTWSKKEDAEKY